VNSYIDTCVARWLVDGNIGKLTVAAKEYIEKTDLLISPIVILELQYLFEIRRVSQPAQEAYQYLHQTIGLTVCEFPLHTVIACAVGESWTRDPFDRLIVSHAKANGGAPLITADESIRENYRQSIW
jgi:PIN domain nuclease of toxin-antitoxin system